MNELVDEHTDGRSLGFLGEHGVNVLELNVALDPRPELVGLAWPPRLGDDQAEWLAAAVKRRSAIPDQMSSTTPKGHAPERNPYALERRQPTAKPRM